MRGKQKIWKNTSLLTTIALLLMAASLIRPSFAGITTLSAPEVTTSDPTVWINIAITDAVDLWGFQLFLSYDTSVLNAIDYAAHPIFFIEEPSGIEDAYGYVYLAFHKGWGTLGFTGSLPNLVSIKFEFDGNGQSQLEIYGSVLSDHLGDPIPHVTVNGYLCNVPGAPIADFTWAPEAPIAKELITFTSTSSDSDGTCEEFDWDFDNDGFFDDASGMVVTNKFMQEGAYTVGLRVTDNDGKIDSFFDVVDVLPKPPKHVGAKIQTANCSLHSLNFSVAGVEINRFRAQVRNLNTLNDTLVRVAFYIYDGGMTPIGIAEPEPLLVKKGQAKQFRYDFDYTEWGFMGPTMQYIIVVHVYYMDYYIGPGRPHWVETPEQKSFSFMVYELAPVALFSWTDLGGNTTYLDATASYDPDEWLGDSIVEYMWRLYIGGYPGYDTQFGETLTYTWPHAGTWTVRLYVTDSLGATSTNTQDVTTTP